MPFRTYCFPSPTHLASFHCRNQRRLWRLLGWDFRPHLLVLAKCQMDLLDRWLSRSRCCSLLRKPEDLEEQSGAVPHWNPSPLLMSCAALDNLHNLSEPLCKILIIIDSLFWIDHCGLGCSLPSLPTLWAADFFCLPFEVLTLSSNKHVMYFLLASHLSFESKDKSYLISFSLLYLH